MKQVFRLVAFVTVLGAAATAAAHRVAKIRRPPRVFTRRFEAELRYQSPQNASAHFWRNHDRRGTGADR
jgi:hypothetical protein